MRCFGYIVAAAVVAVAGDCPAVAFNPPVWLAGGGTSRPTLARASAEQVIDGGRLHVSWVDEADGTQRLWYRVEIELRSSSFTAPLMVESVPAAEPIEDPDLFADKLGRAHMVWLRQGAVWYASVQGNVVLEKGIVPNATGIHPTVRAFPWGVGEICTPMIGLIGPQVVYRPLYKQWSIASVVKDSDPKEEKPHRVLGGRFDASASPGAAGTVHGMFILRCQRLDEATSFYRPAYFYRREGAAVPRGYIANINWGPAEDPTDEVIAVQSIGHGTDDMVAHFAFTDHPASGGTAGYLGQHSPLPMWPGTIFAKPNGGDDRSLNMVILPSDTLTERFKRPLFMASVKRGEPRVSYNSGGLSSFFAIEDPAPRDLTFFGSSLPVRESSELNFQGEPRVTCVRYGSQTKLRVIVTKANGQLVLYNEDGLPIPGVMPTMTPTPGPSPTIAPTATPGFGGWVTVLDALVSKGRTPTPADLTQGDANTDGVWDSSDIVRLRGGGL